MWRRGPEFLVFQLLVAKEQNSPKLTGGKQLSFYYYYEFHGLGIWAGVVELTCLCSLFHNVKDLNDCSLLEVSSLTSLVPELSWDYWSECFQMASPCSVGFLRAWQLQRHWTFYKAVRISRANAPVNKAEPIWPFSPGFGSHTASHLAWRTLKTWSHWSHSCGAWELDPAPLTQPCVKGRLLRCRITKWSMVHFLLMSSLTVTGTWQFLPE